MSLENSKEERIKQLKRLKTTLQAVLELRKELEKQDEQLKIAENQSQELLTPAKQRSLSRTLRNQRKRLSFAARSQRKIQKKNAMLKKGLQNAMFQKNYKRKRKL